ncbi:MAG: sensor histidine kinase, partial [Syntrophales bacterium]
TSLKLYLETFAKYELSRAEQLRYIGFMLQDAERLSVNINSILNLARIESKLYEGQFSRVDLVETTRQFIAQNRHLFRDSDISVENPSIRPIMYPVVVSLFEMFLINILTNAMKYNISERPRMEISFERVESSLLIRFRDNGIGLLPAEKKQIFRKFTQGRHDDRIPAGGSGIGLYLVLQIARLHHGKVVADSEGLGRGAVFTLTLPWKTPEEKEYETDSEEANPHCRG